jgi:acetylornithine deacetylase/succinyl-diaminopimelate desuccinylase-like protein
VLKALADDIRGRAMAIARETRTEVAMTLASRNPPALAHDAVKGAVGRAADRAALKAVGLPSGAGHDAQMVAALCPMGMIFVPSIGGISHSPLERTTWEDCGRGAAVLLGTILDLDARATID